jgi:hypothetical protein
VTALWQTDAANRIREWIEREDPPDPDIRAAVAYARRLELDPFDAPFTRDHETGQFWVRIEAAGEGLDQVLVCSFGVDAQNRRVHVTAFTYLRDNFFD